MTQPERDDEFEAFLKRRTVLPPGMSVDDKLEPPAALDARVLRKAREAIHADKQSQRAPRWALPLAIAATVLLCFSIVMNVSLNTNRTAVDQQRSTVANADKPAGEAAADDAKMLQSVTVTGQRREAEEDRVASAAPTATVPTDVNGPITNASGGAKARARAAAPPDAKLAAVRPPVLADAQSSSSAPAPAQMVTEAALPAPDVAVERPALEPGASPPASPPPPSPSDAAQAPLAKKEVPSASLPANELLESVVTTTNASAPASHPRDPKTWLKQIDALRAQGRAAAADAEMQRFRTVFPNYPVKPGQ